MASHRYLLDTNILSELIKHPSESVAHHVADVGEDAVCTSIVVACELRYGAEKKGSHILSTKMASYCLPSRYYRSKRAPKTTMQRCERHWSKPAPRSGRTTS